MYKFAVGAQVNAHTVTGWRTAVVVSRKLSLLGRKPLYTLRFLDGSTSLVSYGEEDLR